MDLITSFLHAYLKFLGLKFNTKTKEAGGTSTNIETQISGVNISTSILVLINPQNFSISITLYPFLMIDCQNDIGIKIMQGYWDEEQRFSKLKINEEGCIGKGRCFSLQICLDILSDANGLTRSLWHKYFGRLFNEIAKICHRAVDLKNEMDGVDILSI